VCNNRKPLLRWVGGKNWLASQLNNFFDFKSIKFNNYHEPFVGGGSIMLNIAPQNDIYLSDINSDLINCYRQIQNDPLKIVEKLKGFEEKNNKIDYYEIRSQKPSNNVDKAVQFIYLNRTSFNGIYRVNLKGVFNVPYGYKTYNNPFEYDRIFDLSQILDAAIINCYDFSFALEHISSGDLIYLDPPYIANHQNNGFLKYNETLFSWDDQKRLNDFIMQVVDIGAFYILSNADHSSIRDLFSGLDKPLTVDRYSVISGKVHGRKRITELLFSNIKGL